MKTKICKDCLRELPLTEFYKCSTMLDGHLNSCKDCVKARVMAHREKNIESIREYDRKRSKLAHRINQNATNTRKRRREVPGYGAAHCKLKRAVDNGRVIKPETCCHCGNGGQIEAHHEDYSKPLEVIWLCASCHKLLHLGKSDKAKELQAKYKVPGR